MYLANGGETMYTIPYDEFLLTRERMGRKRKIVSIKSISCVSPS